MSDTPAQAYTGVVAEFRRQGVTDVVRLLRAKREAAKEEIVTAGTPPAKREQLAGAAMILEEMIQDLTRPRDK